MRGLLGKIVKVGGPVLSGLVSGGPGGAVMAAAAQAGAALQKRDGRKRQAQRVVAEGAPTLAEARSGGHHQWSAPSTAVGLPVALTAGLESVGVQPGLDGPSALLHGLLSRLGVDLPPEAMALIIGALTWLSHYLGRRLERSAG